MKPFYLLLTVFAIAAAMFRINTGEWKLTEAGNISMGIMLLFTALGHFKFTRGMMKMVPSFIPYKKMIVLITGIFEIAAGIALFFAPLRFVTGLLLITFFIGLLPANIMAANNNLNYETGMADGPGRQYLWFRIPLQLFFIAWVCYFCIFLNGSAPGFQQ